MKQSDTVLVVDDDPVVLQSLAALLGSIGLKVEACEKPQDALSRVETRPGCAILDVRMPGMSGLELLEQLRKRFDDLPIIFITGHGEVPIAVRAMKAGALDFLEKPFSRQQLLDCVNDALKSEAKRREGLALKDKNKMRIESLTAQERKIVKLIMRGLSSKMIADELGISVKTVETHRASTMSKMQARNVAEMVRMAVRGGLAADEE